MKRKDLSVTIALCVSLVAHGVGMIALTEREIIELRRGLYHPAFDLKAWLAQHPRMEDLPADAPLELAKALPEPKLDLPEFEELFGERGSKGKALNASPGEQPMQAQEGTQEQAALTTTPGPADGGSSGNGGSARPATRDPAAGGAHAMALLPTGPKIDPAAPFGVPLSPPPQQLPPRPVKLPTPPIIGIRVKSPDTSTTQSAMVRNDSPATRPVEQQPATRPADVAVRQPTTSPITDPATTQPVAVVLTEPRPKLPIGQMPTTTQPSPIKIATTMPIVAIASTAEATHVAAPAVASAGGMSRPAGGEPGNKSESESDPFSTTPTIIWTNGKVEARDGRKVKTVRPKLTEAGRVALMQMETPVIILAVHIDEKGKVTAVDYSLKSGIPEVDLPHYRCAFEWEFEPSKDKNGNPKPDVLLIPFIWH